MMMTIRVYVCTCACVVCVYVCTRACVRARAREGKMSSLPLVRLIQNR